jgi:hypothetical protein
MVAEEVNELRQEVHERVVGFGCDREEAERRVGSALQESKGPSRETPRASSRWSLLGERLVAVGRNNQVMADR